jgi:hypothetical protein
MLHLKTQSNWKKGFVHCTRWKKGTPTTNLDGNIKFFLRDLKVREPDSIVGLQYPTTVKKIDKPFITFHIMDLRTRSKSTYQWNKPRRSEVPISSLLLMPLKSFFPHAWRALVKNGQFHQHFMRAKKLNLNFSSEMLHV